MIQSGHGMRDGRTDGRTDRRTDGRTDRRSETSIPPQQLRCAGGIITSFLNTKQNGCHFAVDILKSIFFNALQWRHYEQDGVSNHQPQVFTQPFFSRRRSEKHQSSTSLAFMRGIHWWPVNSLHKRSSNVENVSILKNCCIGIQILLKFVPKSPVNNKLT